MKIGNVTLENNVFLAPMAGVTDKPFRIICKEMGAGLVYSEMISAKGILYENKNTKFLLETDEIEKPIAMQLFGRDPDVLGEVCEMLNEYPFEILDFNMGCPVPKIVKVGEGSALMKEPKLVSKIVKKLVASSKKPVTVKIRKGFDDSSINAVEIAKIIEANGASAITVHGRTREEYYSNKADLSIIKKVKESVSIPVIGNGDIYSPEDAKAMFDFTNCDGIMIGRGAEGNPFIFKEVNYYLNSNNLLVKATMKEKMMIALRHAKMLVEFKGEKIAIQEMRKHMANYSRGIKYSAQFRSLINSVETYNEFVLVTKKFMS